MSRIILSKYEDGSSHVVVGWDPARGAFWQEWATEEEIAAAEKSLSGNEATGGETSMEEALKLEVLVETGVKREGRMWPGIALDKLIESMPEELRSQMTEDAMKLLAEHAEDPDSGYIGNRDSIVDLTDPAERDPLGERMHQSREIERLEREEAERETR